MRECLIIAMAALFLTGCDFIVPLAEKPEIPVDKRLVGLWELRKMQVLGAGEDPDSLLVLPLDEKEYLVVYPAGIKDSMYGRAFAVSCAGKTWMQIRWFGTGKGAVSGDKPEDAIVYQFVSYECEGDSLTVRLLNSDAVGKDWKTPGELRKAIEAKKDADNLLREPTTFSRVKEK